MAAFKPARREYTGRGYGIDLVWDVDEVSE